MATITAASDDTVLTPALVLNYGYSRQSRNIVLEPYGSKYPTVFLREAQSKSGTLSLLFLGHATARTAADVLGRQDRYSFEEGAVGEAWDFIVTGAVTVTKTDAPMYWTVSAEVREVEALT